MEKKTVIEIDEYDRNIIIRALNDLRTSMIQEKRPTDPVDDLMTRIYEAKQKWRRVAEEKAEYEGR